MPNENDGKHLKLWTLATYRIEVEGHLDEHWSDRLGSMRITTLKRADQTVVTTLIGRRRVRLSGQTRVYKPLAYSIPVGTTNHFKELAFCR